MKPYEPIDCGVYDQYELWSMRKVPLRVQTAEGDVFEGVITELNTLPEGEFALFDGGQRLRLDAVVSIEPLG
ncbi:hypothetical protein GC167_05325 [bacterium]|nr:hypothetical protein [bacterium]